MTRVCFVCLGNICRSPLAETVFVKMVRDRGLEDRFSADSAGTGSYHVGELPDPRGRAVASRRGYSVVGAARQFKRADFARFDRIVAMDSDNLAALRKLAPDATSRNKIELLRNHDPQASGPADVPDPYYGGDSGFDEVIDICERSCKNLIDCLVREGG